MTTIRHRALARAPRKVVFDYVNDYTTVPKWMFGVTKFEPVTDITSGVGATFDATMKIGPKSLSTTLRTTEWIENELVVLESVAGLSVSTRWAFSDDDADVTAAQVEFNYSLPGGIAGRALAALVEPVVGQAIKQTEASLVAQVEGR